METKEIDMSDSSIKSGVGRIYKTDHLKPFRFKPGQSGNPGGRHKSPLKQFARDYIIKLSKEEKIKFLNSIGLDLVWRMAEGNPEVKLGGDVKVVINVAKEIAEQNDIIDPRTSGDSEG